MLTSSPTISAPSSPSAPFHTHSRSSYHASRRTSASSSAHSPRFYPQVTGGPPRRHDVSAYSPTTAPIQSPAAAFARSPQIRKREYSDAGTQYTPPDFPPTYRPPVPYDVNNELGSLDRVPEIGPPIAKRGETSAEEDVPVTEPPEPNLRIDPVPAVASRHVTQTKRTSSESERNKNEGERADGNTQGEETSPIKRARPSTPGVKIMPLRYELCDVKDLGVLVSDMLMELVRLNDGIPLRDGQLTRFHSRAPPGISVRDYLNRLIVHATLSPPIILSMVFYVDKLCALYPAFTISSLTVHRFLITAATVAAKGLSDSFWTNSLYARVGGVSVRELALLELEFLRRLEWRIVPRPETLVDYYKGLVERGNGYAMEKEEPSSSQPSTTESQSSGAEDTSSRSTEMETDPRGEAPPPNS